VQAHPQKVLKNYFVAEVSEMARYAIPFARNIEQLMPILATSNITASCGGLEFNN
jgi:hypothetical protein